MRRVGILVRRGVGLGLRIPPAGLPLRGLRSSADERLFCSSGSEVFVSRLCYSFPSNPHHLLGLRFVEPLALALSRASRQHPFLLFWTCAVPPLVVYTGNLKTLEGLKVKDNERCKMLTVIYRGCRAEIMLNPRLVSCKMLTC